MHLRDGLQPHTTVASRYDRLVETGAIVRDPAQAPLVQALDRLLADLIARRPARKSSALGWLFARKPAAPPAKGLYIHGGVGRGKTMLMDLFFGLVPMRRKRRAHFNDFMADVQDRLQKQRQLRTEGRTREDDPIPPVAAALAEEARLLCFDEFTVTDIADAMILSRLFSALFDHGVILVATSNVAPDDLYRDGLNRALFLPFVDILKRHADVLLLDSATDHRMEKLARVPVYVTPLGPDAQRAIDEAWSAMTHGHRGHPDHIDLMGRSIAVPLAAGPSARFSFADLCERPLGARDYMAIADRYATVFVENIPILDQARRNEAKRLILLVDTFYDQGIRLVASAAAEPDGLYVGTTGTERFEFERTSSRLTEMRSRDWLDDWAAREVPVQPQIAAPSVATG
jgi:cell division protein ZapE